MRRARVRERHATPGVAPPSPSGVAEALYGTGPQGCDTPIGTVSRRVVEPMLSTIRPAVLSSGNTF
jgi:hypothetical protein